MTDVTKGGDTKGLNRKGKQQVDETILGGRMGGEGLLFFNHQGSFWVECPS